MIGIALGDLRQALSEAALRQFRLWAGAAFMALALVAIEYEEVIAPEVGRISDAWSSLASDLGRRLASFTL